MQRAFVSAITPPPGADGPAWWFILRDTLLLVRETGETAAIPLVLTPDALGLAPPRPPHYLGALHGVPCYVAAVAPDTEPPAGMAFAQLRGLHGHLPDDHFALAGRAMQIAAWDATHQFCGRCGTPTVAVPGERATRCPHCGLLNYPRLSPAVIVRINRGSELLLARNRSFPDAFFSVLAGFVEPGESLEETVRREVAEEVGIEIAEVRYHGSQPWPYPNSLMIGFTATYAGGEIAVDGHELAEARWFPWNDLPRIPPKLSIARQLIDAFVAERERETAP